MAKKLFIFSDNSEDVREIEESDLPKQISSDKTTCDSATGKYANYELWNIVTVADKVINRRIYPEEHVRGTVMDNRWLTPYYKPFLTNHDRETTPHGRVVDNFYFNHGSGKMEGGRGKVPEDVMDAWHSSHMFDEGTGSVIVRIKATDECIDNVKNGIFLTTSQSSATDGFTCSICGDDLEKCEHLPGETYDNENCFAKTGALYPIENSVVNQPANQSSVLMLFDKSTKKVEYFNDNENLTASDSTNKKDDAIIIDVEEVKKNTNTKKGVSTSMDQEKLLRLADSLKKMTISSLVEKLSADAELETKLSAVIDGFEIDELNNVNDLAKLMSGSFEAIIADKDVELEGLNDQIADLNSQITLKDEEIEDLKAAPEVKDEPEVKEPEVKDEEEVKEVKEEVKDKVETKDETEVKDKKEVKEEEKKELPNFIEDNNKSDGLFDEIDTPLF